MEDPLAQSRKDAGVLLSIFALRTRRLPPMDCTLGRRVGVEAGRRLYGFSGRVPHAADALHTDQLTRGTVGSACAGLGTPMPPSRRALASLSSPFARRRLACRSRFFLVRARQTAVMSGFGSDDIPTPHTPPAV